MSYAEKHGLEFRMPKNQYFENEGIDFTILQKAEDDGKHAMTVLKEKELFRFDELPYSKEWGDIMLDGYFQNVKYFEWNREKLLDVFCPKWEMRQGAVSVHVRRGDYLELTEKHPPVGIDWIDSAMARFPWRMFKFFSDDIAWCKQEYGGRYDCEFSEGKTELEDLREMATCEHHINSSSTFSWWGAWLNRNPKKMVVTPKVWMTPKHSNAWTEEIVPKNWIRI